LFLNRQARLDLVSPVALCERQILPLGSGPCGASGVNANRTDGGPSSWSAWGPSCCGSDAACHRMGTMAGSELPAAGPASELARYVAGIRFEHLQPQTYPDPDQYNGLVRTLREQGIHYDIINTMLPAAGADMAARLNGLCFVPRMSTFAIAAVINRAVSE